MDNIRPWLQEEDPKSNAEQSVDCESSDDPNCGGFVPNCKFSENPLCADDDANVYSVNAPRLSIFSGHDDTLMPLLASLGPNLWNETDFPPYASMLLLEVSRFCLDPFVVKFLALQYLLTTLLGNWLVSRFTS